MKELCDFKVAIVRDQLTQYGGAEKTLEALLEIFPQADIFVGIKKPINIPNYILEKNIHSTKIPWFLGFLMPFAYENFDLRKYDIVISEGTAWPKGVLTTPKQLHISYIYTPPRFLYGYDTEGQKRDKWYFKPFLKVIDRFLLMWDFCAAQRPDYIISISQEVAKRVKKFYGRDSKVIYPPVEYADKYANPQQNSFNQQDKTKLKEFSNNLKTANNSTADDNPNPQEEYYLCISRLAAYKNIDILIKAFRFLDFKLKVAGTGREEQKLKSIAPPNVDLCGFVSEEKKVNLLKNCKGFIFPTKDEDFGIAPIEALCFGKPVLSHKSGGPLEFLREEINGMFFSDLEEKSLAQKIKEFDIKISKGLFDKEKIISTAKKFGKERFKHEFASFVTQKLEEIKNARTS